MEQAMALKLGEILVQEGLITSTQLDEALKYQVIFGGRLGTNLIEMGMVQENDVARFLSKKLGVPFIAAAELTNVPENVIKSIPPEMAERHKVVPVRLENRRLTLAMIDPADLKTIDEISFRTGLVIRPAVTPEIRLLQALEKYYQIERGLRYIHTNMKMTQASETRAETAPDILEALMAERGEAEAPGKTTPPPAPESVFVALAEDLNPLPAPPPPTAVRAEAASAPAAPPRQTQSQPQPAAPSAAKTPTRPTAPSPAAPPRPSAPPPPATTAGPHRSKPAVVPPPPVQTPPTPAKPSRMTMDEAGRRLADARDRDDIADVLASYLGAEFPRGALFLLRGNIAGAWKGMRAGEVIPEFEKLQIPLDEPSVLKTVAESKSFYLGPIPRTPFNSMILQELGTDMPDSALVVPLAIVGRVVVILYVDAKGLPLGERLPDLQRLIGKASMAFEILVLKNKILCL